MWDDLQHWVFVVVVSFGVVSAGALVLMAVASIWWWFLEKASTSIAIQVFCTLIGVMGMVACAMAMVQKIVGVVR